jgi:TolB-like protein/DNA-binding winged helix-turn-helix (wHTH) protein
MNEQNQQPQVIYLRGYRVDLQHHALLNEGGAVVELRPQALDLLCLLAQNAGKVMEKQDLLAQVWKGLFVTDDSLVQAIGDIRRAIDDQGHQMIRTVPRRGYRLIEHVPGLSNPDTEPSPETPSEVAPLEHVAEVLKPAPKSALQAAQLAHVPADVDPKAHARKWLTWLTALLLLLAAVFLGWNMQKSAPPPPRLSIVVLPFFNASGDVGQDYIADSITEDVTVHLSRIKGSFVIGRGTAFTYKGKAVDARTLARDLNVRYVLQGTVGRTTSGYHVTAQLIEGVTATNLWADSLDVPLDQVLDIREWVASQLSNALQVQLVHAEARQSAQRINPDSVDVDMQGYSKFRNCWTLQSCEAAYLLFERALHLDPANESARAHRTLNATHLILNYNPTDPFKVRQQLSADVQFLESLGVLDSTSHRALARARYVQGRNEEALLQIDESLKIDPNDADALTHKTLYLIVNGQAAAAIPVGLKALTVSPQDPDRSGAYFYLCHASMHLKKFEDAIDWCERSFAQAAGDYWALTDLVAAYTMVGKPDKAAAAKDKLLKMNPKFSISFYKDLKLSSNPVWLKEIEENIWAPMRRAGIPD